MWNFQIYPILKFCKYKWIQIEVHISTKIHIRSFLKRINIFCNYTSYSEYKFIELNSASRFLVYFTYLFENVYPDNMKISSLLVNVNKIRLLMLLFLAPIFIRYIWLINGIFSNFKKKNVLTDSSEKKDMKWFLKSSAFSSPLPQLNNCSQYIIQQSCFR